MKTAPSRKVPKLNIVLADETQTTLYLNHYLTSRQKKEAIQELGYLNFIILDHYFFKASMKNTDFTDTTLSKELGISERQIQIARLRLIKTGWFLQLNYNSTAGKPVLITILGKNNVRKFSDKAEEDISDMFARLLSQADTIK